MFQDTQSRLGARATQLSQVGVKLPANVMKASAIKKAEYEQRLIEKKTRQLQLAAHVSNPHKENLTKRAYAAEQKMAAREFAADQDTTQKYFISHRHALTVIVSDCAMWFRE